MSTLKLIDFGLALLAAFVMLFLGLERLRAYPELARLIDRTDQRASRLVDWRASADVRGEAAAIARFAWRQVLWLTPVLLLATYLGIRAIAFAAALLVLVAANVGGALDVILRHWQVARTMLEWWALSVAGILFLALAIRENDSGADFVRGALLMPFGLHPESLATTVLEAVGVVSAAWGLMYLIMVLHSGAVGSAVLGILAGTRAAGVFARDRVDKKKLIALATIVAVLLAVIRAFVSLAK